MLIVTQSEYDYMMRVLRDRHQFWLAIIELGYFKPLEGRVTLEHSDISETYFLRADIIDDRIKEITPRSWLANETRYVILGRCYIEHKIFGHKASYLNYSYSIKYGSYGFKSLVFEDSTCHVDSDFEKFLIDEEILCFSRILNDRICQQSDRDAISEIIKLMYHPTDEIIAMKQLVLLTELDKFNAQRKATNELSY